MHYLTPFWLESPYLSTKNSGLWKFGLHIVFFFCVPAPVFSVFILIYSRFDRLVFIFQPTKKEPFGSLFSYLKRIDWKKSSIVCSL